MWQLCWGRHGVSALSPQHLSCGVGHGKPARCSKCCWSYQGTSPHPHAASLSLAATQGTLSGGHQVAGPGPANTQPRWCDSSRVVTMLPLTQVSPVLQAGQATGLQRPRWVGLHLAQKPGRRGLFTVLATGQASDGQYQPGKFQGLHLTHYSKAPKILGVPRSSSCSAQAGLPSHHSLGSPWWQGGERRGDPQPRAPGPPRTDTGSDPGPRSVAA